MTLLYRSTRDPQGKTYTASQAVLQGLSPDGGLFVPTEIPKLDFELADLSKFSYQELALHILQAFFTDYTTAELEACITAAYSTNFTDPAITPLSYQAGNAYLELFHGPTIAFKDLALQLLPHLMTTAAQKNQHDQDIVILTATSGDTGKAAMAGFADVAGTKIIVFYPRDGVSSVQEKQMLTQTGENTYVVGINGNFDHAQTKVKELFNNQILAQNLAAHHLAFSSANSINIGRLFPQIIYYFAAYGQLLRDSKITLGQKINFSVPTGNFGDILAGYFAKKLGLPIKKLICASNKNKVLTDFFNSGRYDRQRPFYVTSSPSMDILVSSNLERLLFYITGEDATKTAALMDQLSQVGHYQLDSEVFQNLGDFAAGFADEVQTATEIKRVATLDDYILDPHTAVASAVAKNYQKASGDLSPMVIVSTASPYKFPQAVLEALETDSQHAEGLEAVTELQAKLQTPLPPTVATLFEAPIRHHLTCDPQDMEEMVRQILKVN